MKHKIQQAGAIGGLFLLFLLFGYHCPFQMVTGLPCPGCNMTTSLYWLLHGNISLSLYYHAVLIPTIVIVFLCMMCWVKQRKGLCTKLLIGWAIMMIVYYGYRMVFVFPNFPMEYMTDSLFAKLFL